MKSSNIDTSALFELIKSRRTSYQFLDKNTHPIDNNKLDLCLDAAIWAPNHKLTQPWRFWIVGEQIKSQFAHIYADNRAAKNAQSDPDCYQSFYDKAIAKFMAIPQVILVGQALADDQTVCKEDYAACACAIQNFQLMAWQQQIGVQWSTGPIIRDQRTYQLLTLDPEKIELIGALYLGNIDEKTQPKSQPKRKPFSEFTQYLT